MCARRLAAQSAGLAIRQERMGASARARRMACGCPARRCHSQAVGQAARPASSQAYRVLPDACALLGTGWSSWDALSACEQPFLFLPLTALAALLFGLLLRSEAARWWLEKRLLKPWGPRLQFDWPRRCANGARE